MEENYVSVREFAERYDMREKTIRRNWRKIPGVKRKGRQLLIPPGTRYPLPKRKRKLDTMSQRLDVLLYATHREQFVDEKTLRMERVAFESLLEEAVACGYLRENGTQNPLGANRYSVTIKYMEIAKRRSDARVALLKKVLAVAANVSSLLLT